MEEMMGCQVTGGGMDIKGMEEEKQVEKNVSRWGRWLSG